MYRRRKTIAVAGSLFVTLTQLAFCYLYLYPLVHRCAFPFPPSQHSPNADHPDPPAPFRLLVLGDPQLEGDTSLPSTHDGYLPSLKHLKADAFETPNVSVSNRLAIVGHHLRRLFTNDIPRILQFWRKKLDLLGNDYYLAHIYRSVPWLTDPTHVAVLGDLIGSQWVSDEEFEIRGKRYWDRVFQDGRKVEDDIMNGMWIAPLGHDEEWKRRIINVAGNHDIGYAGDMNRGRVERFEKMYGKANWQTRFTLPLPSSELDAPDEKPPGPPELTIVVLNTLNMDPPVLDYDLQTETYNFLNDVMAASRNVEDPSTATVLLTHLPLHKEAGTCVDGPYIAYYEGGGVKEQNHLSYDAGKGILEGLYGMSGNRDVPGSGMGRNGIVLTGHDHEGCDVYHNLPDIEEPSDRRWAAETWNASSILRHKDIPGIREITVRSMMGDFGGNAGLLSAWYDADVGKWQFGYSTCSLGPPFIWWAIHVCGLLELALVSYLGLSFGWRLYRRLAFYGHKREGKEKTL